MHTWTKNKAIIGSIAIGIAAIMWGFDGVVLTPRLYNLKVGYVVFVLHALPFLLMNLFFFRQYRVLKQFSLSDAFIFFLVALFGGVLGTLAIVRALFLVNFQDLSIVVLLQKLQPIFAITLAAILLRERITRYFIYWAALAILAGYTLTFGFNLPNLNTGNNTALAAIYALTAAVSFGSSTVFSKMMLEKYSFKTTTFYRYGLTTVIMLIFVIISGQYHQFDFTTTKNWLFFVIIALTTGSGAIFLYYYGLNQVKAIVSVVVELLFPVSTILIDYLVNDNKLSVIQWISAFVMVYAIINLNRPRVASIR